LAELMAYARGRRVFGEKLLRQQDYRFKLVEMEEEIAGARLMTWVAAATRDAGNASREASLAKLHSAKVSQSVAAQGCTMLGGGAACVAIRWRSSIVKLRRSD
jgi:alkylation response protein AidB-like acyl-CoA dehydrogenase